MVMEQFKDNRPRGKGSKGPYKKKEPDAPIPDYINLPDGRRIELKQYLVKRTNYKYYTLKKFEAPKKLPQEQKPGRKSKYTLEDKLWQANATAEDLAEKYGMSIKSARNTQAAARAYIDRITDSEETSIIIDYTKK